MIQVEERSDFIRFTQLRMVDFSSVYQNSLHFKAPNNNTTISAERNRPEKCLELEAREDRQPPPQERNTVGEGGGHSN